MTNTARTLEFFKNLGYEVGVVERFLGYAGKFGQRKDLFGIIDVVGIRKNETIGIQSCGQAFAKHDKKILTSEYSIKWLESKDRKLFLVGWRKVKLKRGSKAIRWKPRIKEYTWDDFIG